MPQHAPHDGSLPFDEAVLECRPLRDAMYRHLTPSRGLRRAVTIGCVPLRAFPAVVGWLAPWDIVSPTEAALRVTQLDLNVRGASHSAALDSMTAAATAVHNAVTAARATPMIRSTNRTSSTPFSKVVSLSIRANAWVNAYNARFCHATRLLLQSLPAVESLAVASNVCPRHSKFWFAEHSPAVPIAAARGIEAKALGAEAIAGYRGLPRITSLDWCGYDNTSQFPVATFSESLLLCRGTLKSLTCGSLDCVTALIPKEKKQSTVPLRLCLVHDAPTCTEPVEPELTPEGRISRTVVTRVPVHWTLERLIIHADRGAATPSMADLVRLMASCPTLRDFAIHVEDATAFWSPRLEPAFKGHVLYRSNAMLFARAACTLPSGQSHRRAAPLSGRRRANGQNTATEERQHGSQGAKSQGTAVTTPPDQLELMNVAHWYARCVLSTFEADPSVLSPGLAQHRAPLQGIISTGEYPAALLWALCRGPEHTALATVHVDAPLMTADDAAALAAVVALAARVRRVERRRQHTVLKTVFKEFPQHNT